ncbi:DUF302 domain-containing protein [Pelodictyon luteolum]|jgi:uncharacterized protein (DUF302 family)|nr:DUF302 domain-containing protein [Pelodictyon luteolum]
MNKAVTFFAGLIAGIILTGLLAMRMMPGLMLTTHESRYATVEETCAALKSSIEANNWQSPATRDMTASIAKQGITLDKQVSIVELCNAQYANDVLATNPEVSTLMPCAWGVYEGEGGKIYITGMNMGLMAKIFGGNIAKVMGGSVADDEAKMLAPVIAE